MTSPDETSEAREAAPGLRRARARAPRRHRRWRGPSRRTRGMLAWLALPVGLLCTGLLITPSYAVFTDSTTNTGNTWSTGSVVLQNNSSGTNATTGSALFTASNLQPGATAAKCVAVTSSGTAASAVSLYVSNLSPSSGGLPANISMTIGIGTGSSGTNGDCTGYTETAVLQNAVHLGSLPTTFGTGGTGWTQAGATSTRIFKLTYTVDMTTPNTLQNSTAAATFVWEAQSS